MFSRVHIVCLLLLMPHLPLRADRRESGLLRLLSGDQLQGDILDVDRDFIRFRPGWSPDETRIPLNRAESLRFHAVPGPERGWISADVTLTNQDMLHGRLLSVDSEFLELDPGGGSPLRLQTAYVQSIRFSPPPADTLLDGALDRDSWRLRGAAGSSPLPPRADVAGRLRIPHQGHLLAGRPLPPLPERFYIEFELLPLRPPFVYTAHFFVPDFQGRFPGSVFLQISHNSVFASTVEPQARQMSNWRERIPEFSMQAPTRYRLLVDGPGKEMTLYLNDMLVKTWEVAAAGELMESSVWFVIRSQNPISLAELYGLRLHRWNGILPPRPTAEHVDWGWILLRDGTAHSGRLEGQSGGTLQFRLREGRNAGWKSTDIWEYRPAEAGQRTPRRRPQDVQVLFGDRGELLTLHGVRAGDEGLRAEGDALAGTVQLPRHLLRALYFTPHGEEVLTEPGLSIDLDQPVPLLRGDRNP